MCAPLVASGWDANGGQSPNAAVAVGRGWSRALIGRLVMRCEDEHRVVLRRVERKRSDEPGAADELDALHEVAPGSQPVRIPVTSPGKASREPGADVEYAHA